MGVKGSITGDPMESFLSCPNRKLGGKMAYLRDLELLLAAPSEENYWGCQRDVPPS